jgi:hypothetical protein
VSDFVARHLGPADFHDGSIERVDRSADRERVTVRGESGQRYSVIFSGVTELQAVRPEGMLLYALSESPAEGAVRRFSFTNWEDEDDARLEISATAAQIELLQGAG